ncbi:unnamed protein product [Arctia plantaginis]|uniref:Uncharacterized protein n=1 Tax=Arctia plantaginis TaxID=874455 RepID=A0A8S1AS13_ARCPL|nr:unnamed protein product [Arctia plantaginis]CAB3247980.1 unnamed protein product [Arctia plantaginis]
MEITAAFLFLFNFVVIGTKCADFQCDVTYALKITSSVSGCEDFKNDFMDCTDLILGTEKGDVGNIAKLGGKVVTAADISCDFDCEVDIWKVLDMGNEYMYNMKVNFGSSLKDTDAPWYPVLKNLNITECPVPSNVFEMAELELSLDCVKDVLTHEFCGDYRIQFCFIDVTDKISCHTLDICIFEVEADDC